MKRRARSAITGRFVKLATARRWPRLTIIERIRPRPPDPPEPPEDEDTVLES